MTIEELQAVQGWSDETLGKMALEWVKTTAGPLELFMHHIKGVAATENEADEDMDAEDEGDIDDE